MLRYTLFLITAFLFIASLFAVNGYRLPDSATPQAEAQPQGLRACTVLKVFDGDTFACDLDGNGKIDGKPEHIRMLGIDSTEMHYSRKNKTGKDMPYALEATRFVEQKALRKTIYLEYDRQKIDKYHRQLAYVYLDTTGRPMLNEVLLEQGLAKTLFIGINRRYQAQFEHAERAAQQGHRGMWH